MVYVFIILLIVAVGLAVALYFQVKRGQRQADEQQQLLTDYQHRVDDQQKLLDDYRALEKNFDNIGEGYEQALMAFDKMEEESQKTRGVKEALEKRCQELQQQNAKMVEAAQRGNETLMQVVATLNDMAHQSGDMRLSSLAGKISDIEDVEGNKAIERTDNIMVSQVADEAVKVSGVAAANYLKFDQQIAPDAAATMLHTNLQKATRALTHLLDNALKFTTEGSVTLRVSVDMEKMQAIYVVEDTGNGIEAADAERIFEPYVKLNQYFDGQGVGLTVARSIARRLDGDVVLDDTYEGSGSRFVLTLPI